MIQIPALEKPEPLLLIIIMIINITVCKSQSNVTQFENNEMAVDLCRGWSVRQASSCPVKCFRTDPVCGVDGVTYWCGRQDAMYAGTKVAKKGFCEVGNNGAAAQALLLLHIVWLIVLALSVLFGMND